MSDPFHPEKPQPRRNLDQTQYQTIWWILKIEIERMQKALAVATKWLDDDNPGQADHALTPIDEMFADLVAARRLFRAARRNHR